MAATVVAPSTMTAATIIAAVCFNMEISLFGGNRCLPLC